MYAVVLAIHNILRWVVLILGIWAVVRAWRGWLGKREWADSDRKVGVFFSAAIDTQLLLGLLLYFFLSPITKGALRDFGAVMSAGGDLSFFAVEHVGMMVLAVIFAHLGSAMAKKAKDAPSKHKQAAIWFSLTMLSILVAIPWWRPLFPGL
ncbi:MAG: hypothetical protein A2Z49_10350 [Chloroflexi bacterium RBG_19FT_COMBO_56_12]|nr:MAG: hypothetical protein A2Z49_10350 [Chloroflexi bacterium RBG_19FT_COMBO_56_12]